MSRAIAIPMSEHRLIVKVLGALESFEEQLSEDEENRGELARFAELFRDFADRCRHGKEEDRLFLQIMDHGFSKEMTSQKSRPTLTKTFRPGSVSRIPERKGSLW